MALGVIAAISSVGGKDEPIVQKEGDCASCSSRAECKLADLKENTSKKKKEALLFCLLTLLLLVSCSTKKNTSQTRWWHSFNARYNTYFNGSQAFIDGSLEKENGNKDNHTELIPLYTVTNKNSRELGKGNFDRAVEKSEKVIKLHSIKKRPEWKKNRRKTQKDIEWLNRREYNPFLWHAWLLLGKSQFQQGQFEEAAATFSYMSRLYQTQRAIHDIARAWQAKSYTELGWIYDAEDVITKQRRDTIHYRARQDWDYTHANFYVRSGRYEEAIPYLQQVIKHERRRKQKAREWYLLGQLQTALNRKQDAYNSYGHVIRLNPPYELEFNARISQTEVMPATDSKHKISKLRRMARSDKNKEYLDQVYYAIGNVYLTQRDTLHAIEAYEEGNEKATRSGIEKGVLLLTLGNLYWDKEKYGDARRCYGEAIGLLDKDRKDYQQLANRSKVLDELVPHTDAVELQDSLQRLAKMPEAERNKIIDKVIEDLIKKEKEEKRKQEEAEADKKLQQEEAKNGSLSPRTPTTPTMSGSNQSGLWYFYNPQAVSQGKQTFQRQWGKRQNQDNWQRINQTVVNLNPEVPEGSEAPEGSETPEGSEGSEVLADSTATETPDSAALDPHKREYYLAQIPFTEDQLADSHNQIKDGLYHSGIIFKDKLDNLSLSRKALTRLINDYPDYEHNDEVLYHLFLLYSRQQLTAEADQCLAALQQDHPESDWTILLSDPNFMENQRFGTHIEDSVYAATYEAFKASRYEEVKANTNLSETRFPLGQHRPKFMFIEGLSLLNEGDDTGCAERLKSVVEQYPQSEVTELAGMILRGVQQGRKLQGGKFDIDDIWSRRSIELTADSTLRDTLRFERNVSYVFLLAYQPDSINQNQLLFELAKYNFSNYMVRNFDIQTDQDPNGLCRMLVSGFLSYDEAHQYARQLYSNEAMTALLRHCRSLIVSEPNLRLLGTSYSYRDYELFFEQQIAPVEVSPIPLLDEPESIIQAEEQEEATEEPSEENPSHPANSNAQPDDFILDAPQQQNNSGFPEFDDDFWR